MSSTGLSLRQRTAERRVVLFDAALGSAEQFPLPQYIAMLGGKALAEALAVRFDGTPSLIFAPGLLAASDVLPASRCSVSCHAGGSGFAFKSAGGLAARTLARLGIGALVLRGSSSGSTLRNLVVSENGITLAPSRCVGTTISSAFTCLNVSRQQPDVSIVAGPAGEMGIPIASLAFGNAGSSAVSRAGGGAGSVLAGMKIKAVLLQAHGLHHQPGPPEETERELLRMLMTHGGRAASRCTGCTPGCAVRPGADQNFGAAAGKWPGYAELWADGDREHDRANVRRYANFCDEFGLDSFALAYILADARKDGRLPVQSAPQILDELERLLDRPEASLLFDLLMKTPCPARQEKRTPWTYFIDSIGLCGFAAASLEDAEDRRTAFVSLAADALGLDTAALAVLHGGTLD